MAIAHVGMLRDTRQHFLQFQKDIFEATMRWLPRLAINRSPAPKTPTDAAQRSPTVAVHAGATLVAAYGGVSIVGVHAGGSTGSSAN